MKYISNPSLYQKLSKPLASEEEARERMQRFHEELRDLREKHQIPDLALSMVVYVQDGEHPEGKPLATTTNMGNLMLAPGLFALGYEQYFLRAGEKIEPVSEGEFQEGREKKEKHFGCCPECGSGDMRWCSISVRPYCNECNYWAPINHGSEEDALRRLKEKQIKAKVDPTNKV